MPRPTKYSDAKARTFCQFVSQGNFLKTACTAVGISWGTYKGWMQRKPEFAEMVRDAQVECEAFLVRSIMLEARNDPNHAKWLLTHGPMRKRWMQGGQKAVSVQASTPQPVVIRWTEREPEADDKT
jgi:hypothetical protein